jgi:hypothetical protein
MTRDAGTCVPPSTSLHTPGRPRNDDVVHGTERVCGIGEFPIFTGRFSTCPRSGRQLSMTQGRRCANDAGELRHRRFAVVGRDIADRT